MVYWPKPTGPNWRAMTSCSTKLVTIRQRLELAKALVLIKMRRPVRWVATSAADLVFAAGLGFSLIRCAALAR